MNVYPSKPTVLLVDAEKTFRDYLKVILDTSVFNIFEALDGNDASLKYECTSPAIMIVDMHIPIVDGISLIQDIRSKDLNIKIIALSNDEHLLVKARKHGANEALLKTFEPEFLRSLLETYIQNNVCLTEGI